MFKSCGKLEAADLDEATRKTLGPDHEVGRQHTCAVLSAVTNNSWQEFNVHHLVPKHVNGGDGSLVLDTAREFRLKLHLASMPLGWLWMIPAFHIPSTPEGQGSTKRFHTMTFPKSQVDFTLGPGAAVHKVIVRLEDVAEGQGGSSPAPLYTDDQEKKEGLNDEKAEKLMGDSEK
jgi:phosphatidylinositol-3,4,5-trisphosphate 3-phosphatase/dual-specificity protein phosphatase PTEN